MHVCVCMCVCVCMRVCVCVGTLIAFVLTQASKKEEIKKSDDKSSRLLRNPTPSWTSTTSDTEHLWPTRLSLACH